MNETTTWRILPAIDTVDSYQQMAIEEAIMNAVRRGEQPPTLRFYSWRQPAIAVGFFQSISEHVAVEQCKHDKVEIFRRLTGGGAVYKQPEGELNYSIILPEHHTLVPKDITSSYKKICEAVMRGMETTGVKATFKPINDILVHGKKISGNAQTRVNNIVLQHGTILLHVDAQSMFNYLRINKDILREKGVSRPEELVIGLDQILETVDKRLLEHNIIQGFEDVFNIQFEQQEISDAEAEEAKILYTKYASQKWNFWKP